MSRFLEFSRSGNVCLQLLKRAEAHVTSRLANDLAASNYMGCTYSTPPIEALKCPYDENVHLRLVYYRIDWWPRRLAQGRSKEAFVADALA